MRNVKVPDPLSKDAFAPFGEIISPGDKATRINYGTCHKFARLARIDCAANGGVPVIHRYQVAPVRPPIRIERMERHRLASQSFIPLGRHPYLVVVAPPGEFNVAALRVFIASGDQGVHYRRGVWHHFCLALDVVSDFLVIDREADLVDCDEIMLTGEEAFEIHLQAIG